MVFCEDYDDDAWKIDALGLFYWIPISLLSIELPWELKVLSIKEE
jgi:hypothetical protein